jgi:HlyD family secretion protein
MREEFAFVVENGRALRKEVKTGVGNWSTLEVLDGLKEGDKIVSSLSVPGLDDGVKVRVVDKLEEE